MQFFRFDRHRVVHEVAATLKLAMPLIFAQLAAMGSSVVDTVLSGHVSRQVLGAVAVGTGLWSLALVVGIGMMMAVPSTVSHLEGAGERDKVGKVLIQALWLALMVGLLLLLLTRHAIWLVDFMGVDPSLRQGVARFLAGISWGAPALTCYFAMRGMSEGMGLTRPSMWFAFGGLVILAPLDYALMYGRFGIPPQGAGGCGAATAAVLWLQMLGLACYIWRRREYRGLGWDHAWHGPQWRSLAPLWHIGLPMAVSLLAESGMFVAAALLIGRLGASAVAAHQVALNISALFFMVPLGLSMAITVRVGHAAGRNDSLAVAYAGFCGIGLTLLTQALSASLLFSMPRALAHIYTSDPEVTQRIVMLLLLAGLFQFSDGIQVASGGALRGLKDTRVPMLITVFAYWLVGLPVGWYLAFQRLLGARGMWMGMIAGLSVAAVLLFGRFYHRSRTRLAVPGAAD
ncbi:MATE family efflux transporter [Frateuria aurantia]